MSSALVFHLAAPATTNRFTVRDRIELERWTDVARQRGFDRLMLHERLESDPSDVGNYLAVYAEGCCWASWGLSRRTDGIVAWDCVSGLDLGSFRSMHDALSWVLERRADTIRILPGPAAPRPPVPLRAGPPMPRLSGGTSSEAQS